MDNTQNKAQPTIPCPECDTPINILKDAVVGKIIECPACGIESEIISTSPVKLSPLEEEK